MAREFKEGNIALWRSAELSRLQPGTDEPVAVRILRALPGDRYMVEFPLNPAARARELLEDGSLSPSEEDIARRIIAEGAMVDDLLEGAEQMPLDGPFVVGGSDLSPEASG